MRPMSYDTETTGLYPYLGHEMFSYSTCTEDENVEVVRLDGSSKRQRIGTRELKRLWKNLSVAKVMHNAKFDLSFTEKELGRRLDKHTVHDTMIMSHILQNDRPSHALKNLAYDLADFPKDDEKLIKKYTRGGGSFQDVPEKLMQTYQKGDAERTMLLYLFFYSKIQANETFRKIYNEEMELVWTTLRMEQRGIMVNKRRCRKLIRKLSGQVEIDMKKLRRAARREINPNSPGDLVWLLFTELGLPVLERTPKTQAPTTKKEVLMQLLAQTKNPVLNLIMRIRAYERGTTTLASYLDFCDGDSLIHPKIHTNGAVSSRESCSEPNLQNVSKKEVHLNPYPVPARNVFQPKPGYVNYHFDYSGIEMRLLVHYSGDKKMTKMFKEGEDPHVAAAKMFFVNTFLKASSKEQKILRDGAKDANFGIPYGAGLKKVCESLGLTTEVGRPRYNEFKRTFPGFTSLGKRMRERASEMGYIETAFGRRLYVPHGKAYIATNYLIQGTAAGVLKRAQNRVHRYLQEATGGEAGLLLPIHDEIIIEFPKKRLKEAPKILEGIKKRMENFEFNVPLVVDAQISTTSWTRQEEITIGGGENIGLSKKRKDSR